MVVILFSKKGKAARARSVSPGRALTSETSKMKKELNSELWTPKDYSLAEWVLRTWIGPAVLVFLCPLFVNLAALAMIKYDGSIVDVLGDFWSRPGQVMADAFPPPNKRILSALALFVVFQFVLLLMIPGKTYFGPISPAGERPVHVRNGHKAFALTFIIFYLLSVFEVMDPCIVFDELMPLMTCLNLSALALSVFLLYKGVYFPSTKDHGSDYPWLFRFYEGEELYPALFGVDLKNFVICRLGMMGWAVFTVSFAMASKRHHGGEFTLTLLASAMLNFIYVVKFFFLYEEGYMSAGDIAVDR